MSNIRPLLSLLLLSLATAAHAELRPAQDPNLAMGTPSGTADPSNRNDYLLERTYFAESYNDTKGTPNWVSWRLVGSDIGHAPRVPFYADTDLPSDFKHVDPRDYTNEGFDRGHMCDHGDRSSTKEASHATFTMANMIPQSPVVNQKAWARLEDYCRQLANQGHTLYIVSGPNGQGGEGKNGAMSVIGDTHQVVVPAKCWKVVLVLDHGDTVDASARTIAVVMPNDMSVGEDWSGFRTSVNDVEALTGYHFFTNAPASVIEPLKADTDHTLIAPPSPIQPLAQALELAP